ncbi:hypothetical protein LXA43DRAFT_847725, partial [Ganoderma leucocontextum]
PKSSPTLTDSRIIPKVVNIFEQGCLIYFKDCDISAARFLAKATANISDALIADWYMIKWEEFDAITFNEFMTE